MSESEQTKKYQPSPARDQKRSSLKGDQSGGASTSVAGTKNRSAAPNVIEENKKTEKGYRDLKKGQRNR